MMKVAKYMLYVGLSTILLACIIAAYIAGVQSRKPLVCKGIRIEVLDSAQNSFVTTSDVRKYLDKSYGKLIGMPLDSIDLVKVV